MTIFGVLDGRRRILSMAALAICFWAACKGSDRTRRAMPVSGVLFPAGVEADLRLGVFDGDNEQVFGEIQDLAVRSNGDLFIIDRMAHDLRWFDAQGNLKGKSGREGSGPGEFRLPRDLILKGDSQVWVADGPLRRLSTFSVDPVGLTHSGDRALGLFGRQVCLVDTFLVVLAPMINENRSLHRVAGEGEVTLSFGVLLREVPPDVAALGDFGSQTQNIGKLWCDPSSKYVFFLHENIPYLRAFDEVGGEVWRTRLSGAGGLHLSVIGGTAVSYGPDPATGTVDHGRAVFPWGRDTLGISLETVSFLEEERTYEVRLVQASTGRELARLSTPMIISAVDQERVYGYVNHPIPMVLAYQRFPLGRRN